MIRVAIADDHPLVRRGLRSLIAEHSDLEVVAEADSGDALLRSLRDLRADVVLLDVTMPGPGFLELTRTLLARWPSLRVLVISAHAEEPYALKALQAGASGYLTKDRSAAEMVTAIRRVAEGRRYLTSTVADRLAARAAGEGSDGADALSIREFEVLVLLASGKSLKEVGVELGVSPKTVSTYRARVLDKLGLKSTADLIRYAIAGGLVDG